MLIFSPSIEWEDDRQDTSTFSCLSFHLLQNGKMIDKTQALFHAYFFDLLQNGKMIDKTQALFHAFHGYLVTFHCERYNFISILVPLCTTLIK